jgi:hypothetical protein
MLYFSTILLLSLPSSCRENLLCFLLQTMHRRLFPFGLGLFTLLRLADSTPIQIRQTEHISTAVAFDVRSTSDSCAADQPSVYICQN